MFYNGSLKRKRAKSSPMGSFFVYFFGKIYKNIFKTPAAIEAIEGEARAISSMNKHKMGLRRTNATNESTNLLINSTISNN